MNHDTNKEVKVSSKQTMLTAQSDSVELYHALCDRLIELIEKTNEVERLREQLTKFSVCLGNINRLAVKYAPESNGTPLDEVMEKLLARLAPAPEESVDKGEISDGYHTFNELYDHRCTLFLALLQRVPSMSWISKKHDDGSSFDGWFIAGMRLPSGDVTYHLPEKMWDLAVKTGAELRNFAPKWDGHKSPDVVIRLKEWIKIAAPAPEEDIWEKAGLSEPTEPAPEWRELGQDEVICEGDQGNQQGTDVWFPAGCAFWGMKHRDWGSYRFRTRRPLPNSPEYEGIKKQEGCHHHSIAVSDKGEYFLHQCTRCGKKLNKFPKPKGDVIEKSALEMLSHGNVFACLRYLRDEIQKLKEAR